MKLTDRFPQKTLDRKVNSAKHKLLKDQLNELCKQIDLIEYNRKFDDDIEKQIELLALKKVKKNQLTAWKAFRTKLGLSNDVLKGI